MTFETSILSGGFRLPAHVVRPERAGSGDAPGLVLCHGFPAAPGGAPASGQTYPEFADRLAAETGWVVLTFNFRGAGEAEGDFSLAGWLDDIRAAIDRLAAEPGVEGVWLAGSSTGGAVVICAGAEDERVRGVATLAAPADFDEWGADPESFLATARQLGVIRSAAFPADQEAWARELREIRPSAVIGKLAPRPILLVHGAEDEVVPVTDGRFLADAAGEGVQLRVVGGAGHRLRHDPRAVALLVGWMERQAL